MLLALFTRNRVRVAEARFRLPSALYTLARVSVCEDYGLSLYPFLIPYREDDVKRAKSHQQLRQKCLPNALLLQLLSSGTEVMSKFCKRADVVGLSVKYARSIPVQWRGPER